MAEQTLNEMIEQTVRDAYGQWYACNRHDGGHVACTDHASADLPGHIVARLRAALAGRTVVELSEPANGYRYGRAWRRTDAEPPADVTLLRNPAHPGTADADLPGPYVKRTPSGGWWFVHRPDEETDPEGWSWAGLFNRPDDAARWFEVVAADGGESRD